MAFFDNIMLAFEALKTNKMRAMLTMLGIIIGIGSVITINTVGTSLTGSVSNSMNSLGALSITVNVSQKSSDDDNTSQDVKLKQFASETPSANDLITSDMIKEFRSTFKDKVQYIELTRSVGTGSLSVSSSSSSNSSSSDSSSVSDSSGSSSTDTASSDSSSSDSSGTTNSASSSSSSTTSVNVTGVNDEYEQAEEVNILYGRFITNEKDSGRKVCVVSDYFIENGLGLRSQEAIGQSFQVTINDVPYTFYIEGVYEYEQENASSSSSSSSTETTDMYIPEETARVMNGDSEGYQSISVVANSETDISTFLTTTGDYFAAYYTQNDTWTCEATSLQSVISTVTDVMNTISYAIAAIAAISLLVGGIGVMNIMLVSITERTREIGTRKALGATNKSIRLQFITESVVICFIGGLIGVIIGLAFGTLASSLLGYTASPNPWAIFLAVGFSMLVGLIFGYAPANKAAKLDPIEALRYE